MPTVDVQDPVKLETRLRLDQLMGQPLPTFQSAMQGIKDWNPAHEWNQNVQNTMFGLGDTVRNVGHAVMHPIDTAKNLQNMPVPSAEEVAMAFNPGHIPSAGLAGAIKKVYYHGSSNDIAGGLRNPEQTGITPTTGGPTNATFVSPSPELASEFAGHRDLVPANAPPYPTGAAVYPVRLNVKKIFDVGNRKHVDSVLEKLDNPEGDVAGILDLTHDKVTRFKQGKMTPGAIHPDTYPAVERPEVLKAIKDAGFDSFYTTGSHWSEKDEMDKAVKNIGVFDPDKIEYAIPEAKKETKTAEENKAAYLEPSKEKGVWYHGTAHDIKQFKPELGLEKADVSGTPYQAGATFVTQNPEFAHVFAKDAPDYMIQHPERHLTPEQMKSAAEDAKQYFKDTYADMPEHRDAMIKSIEEGKPIGEAQDELTKAYKPYLPSGPNIMPVHVRVTNPFDAMVPEHIDALKKVNPDLPFEDMHRTSVLEVPAVQQAIKDAGFDSFYTNEAGNRNLGLFKPEQIKSAIGNEGTYDPTNPVITKKDGGSVTVEDPVLIERKLKLMGLI